MAAKLTLALDAMGGDKAPNMVLKGANIARERFPNVQFLLYGNGDALKSGLSKFRKLRKKAEVIHTDNYISNEETVSNALRRGKKSSMWQAIQAVGKGEADSIVSAGNTGVLMAMSKLILRPVEEIHRPAIASFFPTMRGESVMLDLGANIECDANNMVQFALMGDVFARTVLGFENPSVGILNVGSEEHKGKEMIKEAHATLGSIEQINYHGFIEGDDIAKGTTDVIVTDGFTGNVALKTAEGIGELYYAYLKQSIKSSVLAQIGYLFAKNAFKKLRLRLDPRTYNGAVFMGLNGISVKSHGGTDALGFATAIGVAVELAAHDYHERLTKRLEALNAVLKARPVAGSANNKNDKSQKMKATS